MAVGNDRSLTDVTTFTGTYPFDLIPEILCRLPVELLLQLKCVCKSWKDLISDSKFAKKHLRVSKTYHHHHHVIMKDRDSSLWDCTISSIFSDTSTTYVVPWLELIRPKAINNKYNRFQTGRCFSSCDGILLFPINKHSALLWNPSIRTFKILPPLLDTEPIFFEDDVDFEDDDDDDVDDFEDNDVFEDFAPSVQYTFGYDHFIDNYKVFAVTSDRHDNVSVDVYTLGADSWRGIYDFPYGSIHDPGKFLSGSVNWLQRDTRVRFQPRDFIVSLDLEKESYRRLSIPDTTDYFSTLGVLRDCLCISARNGEFFDVWVMKEYGIEESWTKLFSVPYMRGPARSFYTKVVYVYEDDQVLLDFKDYNAFPVGDLKLVVYNSRNGTFKIPKIQNMNDWMRPEVYVESLISPCS